MTEKIAHYKILKQIGAGGMSEVFLAEDARLNRKVALKLLPADFAADRKRCIALFESLNKEFRYKKRARRLIQNQSSRETRPRQIQNGRE